MSVAFKFIKLYWKEIAISCLLFSVCFFWWADHRGLVTAYEASIESYETRMAGLKDSYEREAKRKQEALEHYQERVASLERDYEDSIIKLEIERQAQTEQYKTLRRENPEQFIAEIEEKLGFRYVH
jgi:ATPase subunit of ABC transporter with duplicated ATPase domains